MREQKHVRLSERVMLDAPPALADVLNDRISPHLPQRVVCEGREWALVTRGKGKAKDPLNRRWRYNRYGPDGYFKPHYDAGAYCVHGSACVAAICTTPQVCMCMCVGVSRVYLPIRCYVLLPTQLVQYVIFFFFCVWCVCIRYAWLLAMLIGERL